MARTEKLANRIELDTDHVEDILNMVKRSISLYTFTLKKHKLVVIPAQAGIHVAYPTVTTANSIPPPLPIPLPEASANLTAELLAATALSHRLAVVTRDEVLSDIPALHVVHPSVTN